MDNNQFAQLVWAYIFTTGIKCIEFHSLYVEE